MNQKPPFLDCAHLPEFNPKGWRSVKAVFSGLSLVSLGQAWRAEPQERLRPGLVRTGWRDESLWVYAELEDVDVFNPETGFNESFFLTGDVFEIFLRPAGQPTYFEFHVGPANQLFQLRIPSAEAFAAQTAEESAGWKIPQPLVERWSSITASGWRVLVKVPFASVVEKSGSRKEWRFSFSRYDYSRDRKGVVLSSSSPHRKVGYHCQKEWGTLQVIPL